MSTPRHAWGCVCGLCSRRAADIANEQARIREHNRQALRPAPAYYQTGPRVGYPAYIRAHEAHPAFDMYYAQDWMGRPKDVP